MAPKFWNTIQDAFAHNTAVQFVLHGPGVADVIPAIDDQKQPVTIDLVPWLTQGLTRAGFDLVITYDLADGINFPLPTMRDLFNRLVLSQPQQATGLADALAGALGGTGASEELPSDPEKALKLLGQALNLVNRFRDGSKDSTYRVALIMDMADLSFPSTGTGYAEEGQRAAQAHLLKWARNPAWRGDNAPMIFLLTPNLSNIPSNVTEASYGVEVPAPNYDDRLSFIRTYAVAHGVAFAQGFTAERFAAMTAGLLLLHVEDVLVKAKIAGAPLTAEMARQRKDELLAAASAGLLESIEATYGFEAVVGLDELKRVFSEDVTTPMLNGHLGAVPAGAVLMGDPGVGKTYFAVALGKEAGMNVVLLRMGNLLGSYVGESEAKLEKALGIIESMAPVVVIVDEAERQVGFKRAKSATGSSVDGNIGARLQNFMSQTKGIFWVLITNYPEDIEPAVMRPGRADLHVLVTAPETDEERAAMIRAMARKNRITLDDNVDPLTVVAKLVDYSGAEIESVVKKAYRTASRDGREVVTMADLEHAAWAVMTTNKADKQAMIRSALNYITDRDLLPPSIRRMMDADQTTTVQEQGGSGNRTGRTLSLDL